VKCGWCLKEKKLTFYCGKREWRCKCSNDYRPPVEKRRDRFLNKYGDDPTAYTGKVLAKMAADGLFDITAAFCPAGKLTLAEAKAREAASYNRAV